MITKQEKLKELLNYYTINARELEEYTVLDSEKFNSVSAIEFANILGKYEICQEIINQLTGIIMIPWE